MQQIDSKERQNVMEAIYEVMKSLSVVSDHKIKTKERIDYG